MNLYSSHKSATLFDFLIQLFFNQHDSYIAEFEVVAHIVAAGRSIQRGTDAQHKVEGRAA